jgi:hypothetical protein
VSSPRSHTYENARSRLLVDPKHRRTVEEILLGMGFYQRSVNSQAFYAAHHHSMPSTTVRGMYGLKFIVAVSLNVEIRSLTVLALMMLKHNPSYLLLTTFRSCGLARSFNRLTPPLIGVLNYDLQGAF